MKYFTRAIALLALFAFLSVPSLYSTICRERLTSIMENVKSIAGSCDCIDNIISLENCLKDDSCMMCDDLIVRALEEAIMLLEKNHRKIKSDSLLNRLVSEIENSYKNAASGQTLNVNGDANIQGNLSVNGTISTNQTIVSPLRIEWARVSDAGKLLDHSAGVQSVTKSGAGLYKIIITPSINVGTPALIVTSESPQITANATVTASDKNQTIIQVTTNGVNAPFNIAIFAAQNV